MLVFYDQDLIPIDYLCLPSLAGRSGYIIPGQLAKLISGKANRITLQLTNTLVLTVNYSRGACSVFGSRPGQ